jgi:hypothetical protein
MPDYFEFKRLEAGYRWSDFSCSGAGGDYARNVLGIPDHCIKAVRCYPDEGCLGVLLHPDNRLIRSDWFHKLVQTRSYLRTDYNLMVFY